MHQLRERQILGRLSAHGGVTADRIVARAREAQVLAVRNLVARAACPVHGARASVACGDHVEDLRHHHALPE